MGCCCSRIKRYNQDEQILCSEFNTKPLTIIEKLSHSYYKQKVEDYQLNDLRSLEGVAKLWSERVEPSPDCVPVLVGQHSNSVPIIGNMYSNTSINEQQSSPITIPTYFFHHTRRNQSDLLLSHSNHIDSSSKKQEKEYKKEEEEYINVNNDDDEEKEVEIEIEGMNEMNEMNIFETMDGMDDEFNFKCDDYMEYNTSSRSNINIGVGASGIVQKAFHFGSCTMIAIKSCRLSQSENLLAFQKEANILYEFKNSKNIIDIIGFGRDKENNQLFMGLEYMDLNSCKSLKIHSNIKNIKIRELVVGYIAFNVLLALNDLHKKLYIHNDIKPDNILVNKYGEIKLSDFDTILQLKNNKDFLIKNNGTQRYQSPEKTIFNICYNRKTDIWSLGITCFELLFGGIDNTNYDQISYTTNPPILDIKKHNLSINCCSFINQCLIKNKHERPSSFELLNNSWFEYLKTIQLKDKWPWLINIEQNDKYYHEDLLFMINALIIHYSSRNSDVYNMNTESVAILKYTKSNKTYMSYTDEQRIENMAKYAFCSKDTVIDRIRVTVSYIKSQLNKMEK